MKKKLLLAGIILFVFAAAIVGTAAYVVFGSNTQNKTAVTITIPRNSDYLQMLDTLTEHNLLRSETTFELIAHVMKFKNPHVGHYTIQPKTSNYELVRLLRKGQHYPVTFSFNNIRTLDQFADKAAKTFFFEKRELLDLLYSPSFLKKYNVNPLTCASLFLPNSYEIYYDITPEGFIEKLYGEHQSFWNEERLLKAQEIGLTPVEVSTLASIVEEENFRAEEKAVIAGLYINRLHKGMLLQSDPTVKFALGDFSRQRILNEDLKVDSPYNTYKYKGLPPGPIRIPEASTLDSVLNYQHHNYLYMCAKEDFSGYHNFTASASVHMQNAARYRKALNNRNIKH